MLFFANILEGFHLHWAYQWLTFHYQPGSGVWREILWGHWEVGADGGQWQPWGGAHRGGVHRVLREWPKWQVRRVDLQGCWEVAATAILWQVLSLQFTETNSYHEINLIVVVLLYILHDEILERFGVWVNRVQEGPWLLPRYLEGGKEAGGQLVDQRFCPRIVEGQHRAEHRAGEMWRMQGVETSTPFPKQHMPSPQLPINQPKDINKFSISIHISPTSKDHQTISYCQVSSAIILSVTPWSVSFTRNPRWTGESVKVLPQVGWKQRPLINHMLLKIKYII